jgi:putative ABC transport system permease protein
MRSYVELSSVQVASAAILILASGFISLALRLRMERSLFLAAGRMVAQLLLVGLILEWVFRVDRWYTVMSLIVVMTIVAGVTAGQRNPRKYPGAWLNTMVSIWVSSWLVAAFALFVVVRGEHPWYDPQYAIPLVGMILGNSLNGISLGINAFVESLAARRYEVEAQLALGATRWEAARAPVRHAVRMGMIPIVNAMLVAGIVSLPGMMTGQLLSGVSPIEAVKYQIVILLLVASATALGTIGVVLFSYRRLFSRDHQLLYDRLRGPD